eukprot:CAMPEP_0185260438 /NCGR_PEP_ID=MMETSP1359-20130426/9030_1 /TAXON_ID=552665 /ORGANISM="Bigelowiella longifila, Strain CCMP242" /LENGTH=385 /DNA_ID=CAMNT_0027846699 /DNA_START=1 /DNA_END=1158 /DNA_ORIENTATION=-
MLAPAWLSSSSSSSSSRRTAKPLPRMNRGKTGLSLLLKAAAKAGHCSKDSNTSLSSSSSPSSQRRAELEEEAAPSPSSSFSSSPSFSSRTIPAVANDIKAISFDFTGTLAQVKGSTEEHYLMALEKSICNNPRLGTALWKGLRAETKIKAKILPCFSKAYKKQMKQLPVFGYGRMTSEEWWRLVINDTFIEAGVPEDLMMVVSTDVTEILYRHFATSDAWELYPEVIPLIKALNSSGIKLGVVSNFDGRLKEILRSLAIDQYFNFTVTSRELGVEKPAKKIFEEAMRKAEVYSPDSMIHVGDTVKTDVLGAMDFGMPFVFIQRHSGGIDGSRDSPQQKTIEELFADREGGDALVMQANTVSNLSAVATFLEDGYRWQAEASNRLI